MLRGSRMSSGLAEFPELLLEDVLLPQANTFLLAWRETGIGFLPCPSYRLLIDGFDILRPGEQEVIVGVQFLEIMNIT